MSRAQLASCSAIIAASIALAGAVAWAASRDGVTLGGIPVVALCAALAFVVQWVAFVPAYLRQTERFYDLTGSITYVAVIGFAVVGARSTDLRSWVLASLVLVWAARLGSFLFRRIAMEGSDSRFDLIKPSAPRFLVAWTLQGLWVFLTLSAALAAVTSRSPAPLGPLDLSGLAVWVCGFALEVVADRQKSRFRARNPGRFVDTGAWAWSRHPNYFGEIVLWTGVAMIASSTLRGWQWVTLLSPFFVAFLLMRVSGVPILERRADARWGHREDYRDYKARTPLLIPRPPRR